MNTDTTDTHEGIQAAAIPDGYTMDDYLRDPLSLPEGVSIEQLDNLATGAKPAAASGDDAAQPGEAKEADEAATAKKQGDSDGDAPGTGTTADKQPQQEGTEAEQEEPRSVQAKDGKNIIPYSVLAQEREQRIRAEAMVQELTEKLAADQHATQTGAVSKTRDLSQIVDEELLNQLREEAPQLADTVQKLVDLVKTQGEELEAVRPSAEQAARDARISQKIAVEDAIASNAVLAHVRTHDPATFNAIAEFDGLLSTQQAWNGRPLAERFAAAVRMYEAANGAIELPGTQQAQPTQPVAQQQPADTAARVKTAIAKAEADATSGPSTLSDIPGGQPAGQSQEDVLQSMSAAALTDRFMNMSPEEIEAQLARLS